VRPKVLLLLFAAVVGCRREPSITVPPGDVASEVSWSADRACAAFTLSNKDGHSPMTTTRVGLIERGSSGYREIRLPAPNERFSTVFEGWQSPGVARIRALTLDGDIVARYVCATGMLEVVK
jgi:hypothetical protein